MLSNERWRNWRELDSCRALRRRERSRVGRCRTSLEDRTVRTIKARPAPMSREEAHAVAHSRELLASLEGLLNAALDCELPDEETRLRAWRAFLAGKGLT